MTHFYLCSACRLCRMPESETNQDLLRMQEQPSVTRFLMLGALETLINQALELEGQASERLASLHGTVVRVRCTSPEFSLYLLVCEDGVEILEHYEGHVDVRVRASLGAMLHWILTAGVVPEEENIQITGPDASVDLLVLAVQEFDLWSALRRWLDEHVRIHDLVMLLRREDPRWLETLQTVSHSVSQLEDEIGSQRLLQEEILDEVRAMRRSLGKQRRLDMTFVSLGLILLLAAFASADGQLPVLITSIKQNTQALLLASFGLTLIVSRILFGYRQS